MLAVAEKCILLVIDMQERLLPAMSEHERALNNALILVTAAREIGVPVLASEQYPKGLGRTVPELAALIGPDDVFAKTEFSCSENKEIRNRISASGRSQIVFAGFESHVCVLQTAFGLSEMGMKSFVTADATASRRTFSKEIACSRLARAGIEVVTTEMVVFEWLKSADAPAFRTLSRLIR